jgi:hypothetical protein
MEIQTDLMMAEYGENCDTFELEWAFTHKRNIVYCPVWNCWVVVGDHQND